MSDNIKPSAPTAEERQLAAMATPVFGWFDDKTQREPVYDPPHDADCPFCGKVLVAENVRTISLLTVGGDRSLFYRVHRTCQLAASDEQRLAMDALILDAGGQE